jgi:hypothetical protein
MDLAFNLYAIPFAALLGLVGTLQFRFRERWWARLQQRRWDDPRRASTKLRDRYSAFLALWCGVIALLALFYDFN